MRTVLTKPSFVAPMLPSLVLEAPAGDDWIHEVKFDGYRTLLAINGGSARAFTRNGYDWSDSYTADRRRGIQASLPVSAVHRR